MNSDQVILAPQRAAVIDDSASSVALMTKLLNSLGDCEPIGFTDSGEALTWCLVNEVDLVIVDYEMPAPNGIAFIEAFRQDSRNKAIPVVMVTSTEDRDIRYMALQIGATDFLTKPIDQVEFAVRMRNLLLSCRAHKTLAELTLWQANYDQLTGLPNRMLLLDRLDQAISSRENSKAAVMHVDLARFKAINDTMGHDAGDEILRQVARRLASEQRQADTVARVGNDEFVIVLTDIGEAHSPQTVAARICEKLQVPFRIGETEVFISASIGIAIFPDDGTNTQQLLRSAAAAMPVAEERGWRFFTPELDATARRHLSLETNLRHALVRNEFQVHYHPLVEVASGRILGAEALLRWRNAELGPVGPDDFIPIAEETGLIVPIGNWVIETICRDMAAWAARGLPMLRIAANVSSRQLVGDTLLDVIAGALASTGVPGHLIELEVTERMMLDTSPQTRSLLERLRGMGLRISIDDFGTGYSSMSYLTSFPFDVLKIDRSFVSRVTERRQDAALTQAIIAMAHSLDLEVVAEGVETPEQLLFLQGAGCEYAQGYLFTKPIPALAFADLLGRTSSFTL